MPDRPAPTYRYWGSKKPVARQPLMAVTTGRTAQMSIYDPIDSWGAPFGVSASEFGQALTDLGDDVDTIELHVHSPGGEAYEGIAIMNQLRQHPATVNVIVDGLAASAASYVAMAGDTVSMAPNATLMIHDASGFAYGQASDMQVMLDRLEALSQNIASVYAAKAGGTTDEWRAAMQPESWYTAEEAVEAGLADRVLPAKAVKEAPTDRFDLSIFNHAGRGDAPAPVIPARSLQRQLLNGLTTMAAAVNKPVTIKIDGRATAAASIKDARFVGALDELTAHLTKTPAEPPVTPPTDHKEADAMSDTLNKGLRERLGVAEDADEATLLSALDEALAEAAEPTEDTPTAVPEGMALVSETLLATLQEGAQAGIDARAKQNAEDRDKAIAAAFSAGKISADARADWVKAWDLRPEQTATELDSLGVRFPVGPVAGYQGHDGTAGDVAQPFTDDEAKQLANLAGIPQGALTNE